MKPTIKKYRKALDDLGEVSFPRTRNKRKKDKIKKLRRIKEELNTNFSPRRRKQSKGK